MASTTIKAVPVAQLKVGMYVNDLDRAWPTHPFAWQCFTIEHRETLEAIQRCGAETVEIDISKGDDIAPAAPEAANQTSSFVPNILIKRTPAEEFEHAKALYEKANKLMQSMMQDVRLGKQIQLEQCEPMVDNILDTMFRSPSTLLPLAQMKNRDEYTFQHSVSVSALAVAFGRVLNLSRPEIKEIALGGLLHDVGKAKVPGKILNKPGKLDDGEFVVMKNHAAHTADVLKEVVGLSDIAKNAAAQHHERYDGTGYPLGLKGEEISLYGQMIAIVDVYDAITSIRVYHKGMPPTEALRKLFEWGGAHFSPRLVQAFIKGVGIYPAGSLVRMESGKLGIVRKVLPEKLLQPVVQLIYDCKQMGHIDPVVVDLSESQDKIKSHESYEKWGINQARWATAENF